jgi:hypothetical protein
MAPYDEILARAELSMQRERPSTYAHFVAFVVASADWKLSLLRKPRRTLPSLRRLQPVWEIRDEESPHQPIAYGPGEQKDRLPHA